MTARALSGRSRLGPYQILGLVGLGGMGEVYRARDPRLQRDVAIKVLPNVDARDPERLKRLQREAQAIGQLNHPNIVAVYDVGTEDDVEYVVMELLEGESLGKLLKAGQLSPRKAVEIATQVARGLSAAHRKNIVHRDLKPDNIFITRKGRVKILDFGLARQFHSEDDPAHQSTRLTMPGTMLGTVAYMSPEQTRGLPLDLRTDIFSFGVVLFEMLAGRRPFERETAFETIAAILNQEVPDLRELVPNLPPILNRIVARCLAKSPEARFQTADDLMFDLETCTDITWGPASIPLARRRSTAKTAAIAAAIVVLAIAGTALVSRKLWVTIAEETSFRRLTYRPGLIPTARFTADGQTVVYSASWGGEPLSVHVLRTDRPESQAVAIPNAQLAAVSRTGEMAVLLNARSFDWTGGGTLAVVPVLGGTPRAIMDGVMQADWLPDGRMAVWRVTEKGEQQLEFPIGHVVYTNPNPVFALRVSPKGDHVALNVRTEGQKSDIIVIGLDGSTRTLASAVVSARGMAWTPDGKEIWYTTPAEAAQVPTIYAVTMGRKRRLVMRSPGWPWLHDIAADGTVLMAVSTNRLGIIVQSDGTERDVSWLDASVLADISAGGKNVLFTESNEGVAYQATVYMRHATDGSPAVRLGEGIALGFSPMMDVALALQVDRGRRKLFLLPTGAGKPEELPNDLDCLWAGWLPDGRILINGETPAGPRMFIQGRDGKPPRPLTPPGTAIGSIYAIGGGAVRPLSPDGRSLLVFDRENRAWLWPLDPSAGNAQPQPAAGVLPGERPAGWSRDGRHLYVYSPLDVPAKVYDVDLVSGERRLLREFAVQNLDGIGRLAPLLLMPDGHSFAYGYSRQASTLYIGTGLR